MFSSSEECRVWFLEALNLQVDYLDPVKDWFQDLLGSHISPDSQGMAFLGFHLKAADFHPPPLGGSEPSVPKGIHPLEVLAQLFSARLPRAVLGTSQLRNQPRTSERLLHRVLRLIPLQPTFLQYPVSLGPLSPHLFPVFLSH